MKIGVCLPYMKEGLTRADYLAWFKRIDEGPFDSLSCGERVLGPTYDMRVLLSAAAAVTERVEINTTLYVLPMHNAVRVAKEIATLDVISAGRLSITVGFGGREKDYAAVGADYKGRYQRLGHQVAQMRSIWAQEPPFAGADPVGPPPLQAGGPRILAGVLGPKSLARCAQWADGVYGWSGNGERHEMENFFKLADTAWQEAGRDTKPYRLGGFWYTLADHGAEKLHQYVYDYLKIADDDIANRMADTMQRHNADAVREGLDNMQAAGCEEVFLVPATAELAEIDRLAEIIAAR